MLTHQQVIAKLRHAADQMGVRSLREGSWLQSIIAEHARSYSEANPANGWEDLHPGVSRDDFARREIERTARMVTATGIASATGASAGELLMLVTEGLAAPVGVPVAAISMILGEGYTAFLQIKMACDLASIYGAPFDPDDLGELAALVGRALDIKPESAPAAEEQGDDDPSFRFTGAIVELRDNAITKHVGKKLFELSALKSAIPVLGVALSARWNYVSTWKLGVVVRRHVRHRAALLDAIRGLGMATAPNPAFIIAGGWLLTTADGVASYDEVKALTAIIGTVAKEERASMNLENLLRTDQEKWFEDLASVSKETVPPLLEVLYLIAATDKHLHEAERRFLCRVGKVLSVEIDFARIGTLCASLAKGERPRAVRRLL
jgi:uncharacterized protein (DUF697 family)